MYQCITPVIHHLLLGLLIVLYFFVWIFIPI